MAQYPYTLHKKTITGSGADGLGNPVGGNANYVEISECRDEKSSGNVSLYVDGKAHQFKAKVYMPLDCPDIDNGNEIEVRDSDNHVRIKGRSILFDRGQYHCRIWL